MKQYDRNIRFFGEKGQETIKGTRIAIAGVGGLGTHIVQQLAYLGVGSIVLIDKEDFEGTNSNRYVGSNNDDILNLPAKVDIGERIVKNINPCIEVIKINNTVVSDEAYSEIINSDYVFGCFDREGVRFILNELCAAYEKPYLDIATDIKKEKPLIYGGRLCCAWDGNSCLHCMNVLDMEEVQEDLGGPQKIALNKAIYGVENSLLGEAGPSVVSINGVVASLAVTEFIVAVTGIRKPVSMSTYRGHEAKVVVRVDPPQADCYYCKNIRGKKKDADVERYIRDGLGEWL